MSSEETEEEKELLNGGGGGGWCGCCGGGDVDDGDEEKIKYQSNDNNPEITGELIYEIQVITGNLTKTTQKYR